MTIQGGLPALLPGHLDALLPRHLPALLGRLLDAAHFPVHLDAVPLGDALTLLARHLATHIVKKKMLSLDGSHLATHIARHGLAHLPGPAGARGLGDFSATSGDLQLLCCYN